MAWMDFETRMRDVIRDYVEPAIELSTADREKNIEHEKNIEKIKERLDLLDYAVFLKRADQKRTIFDIYEEKLADMKLFLY